MPKSLLKFRCYQCGKLLGVSPSKAGRTTSCPSCKADLIVPEPVEQEDADLGVSLARIVEDGPSPRIRHPNQAPSHDPGFSWEAIDTALLRPGPLDEPEEPNRPEPEPEIEVTPPPPPSVNPGESIPDMPAPVLSALALDVAPARVERPHPRRPSADMALTPGILASWSLFVFVAVGLAFVAGLLIGHFVWKGH